MSNSAQQLHTESKKGTINLSRRDFMKAATFASCAALLTACGRDPGNLTVETEQKTIADVLRNNKLCDRNIDEVSAEELDFYRQSLIQARIDWQRNLANATPPLSIEGIETPEVWEDNVNKMIADLADIQNAWIRFDQEKLEISPFGYFMAPDEEADRYLELERAQKVAEEDFRNTAALLWVPTYLYWSGAGAFDQLKPHIFDGNIQMDPLLCDDTEVADIMTRYGGNWYAGVSHCLVQNGIVQVSEMKDSDLTVFDGDPYRWSMTFIGSLFFQPSRIFSQYKRHSSIANEEVTENTQYEADGTPRAGIIGMIDSLSADGVDISGLKDQLLGIITLFLQTERFDKVFDTLTFASGGSTSDAAAAGRDIIMYLNQNLVTAKGRVRAALAHELGHVLGANLVALPAYERYLLLAASAILLQKVDPTKKPAELVMLGRQPTVDASNGKYSLGAAQQIAYPFEFYGQSKRNDGAYILKRFAAYLGKLLPAFDDAAASTDELPLFRFIPAFPNIPTDASTGVTNDSIENHLQLIERAQQLSVMPVLSIESQFLTAYVAFVRMLLSKGELFHSMLLSPTGENVGEFFRYQLPGIFLRYMIENKRDAFVKIVEGITEGDAQNGQVYNVHFVKTLIKMQCYAIAQQKSHFNGDVFSESTYAKELFAELTNAALNKKVVDDFTIFESGQAKYAEFLDEMGKLIERIRIVLVANQLAVEPQKSAIVV